MPVVEFGQWLPDQADLNNRGVLVAKNALPTASGYGPVPDLSVISSNAIDSRPRGAITTKDVDLNSYQFVGDTSKLYELVDNTWTDRSKTGGYSTANEEKWEFAIWKNKVIATNFSDNPQDMELGATAFSDLTTDFKARHVAVVRDFVVFGNTSDPSDDNVPNRVRWSAINDETDYTVSASTLSDFQDLKGGGSVQALVGGEFGIVLMENSVWRMTFVGAPIAFQFDEVLPGIGTIGSGSVVRDGDRVYFLSDRGFFELTNGTQTRPIGANKVDRFVLEDLDTSHVDKISAAADVINKRIYWAYPGSNNVSGRPNRIVVYDQTLDRWSLIEKEVEHVYQGLGTGVTLDGLDSISASLDDLSASLDSRQWKGGVRDLYGFDSDFKSGAFNGSPLTATIDTKEYEINDGYRTRLNSFRPVIDGGSVTAKVGTRNRQQDDPSFGSSLSLSSSGRFTTRENARYHRFRLTISGEWTDAIGIQFDRIDAKRAGRRG